jgi:hypothetical protein
MELDKKGIKVYIENPNWYQKGILFRYNLKLKLIDWFYLDKTEARKKLLTEFINEVRN